MEASTSGEPRMNCAYKRGKCTAPRTRRASGELHSLCEEHRKKQNDVQKKSDARRRSIITQRRRAFRSRQRQLHAQQKQSNAPAIPTFTPSELSGLPPHALNGPMPIGLPGYQDTSENIRELLDFLDDANFPSDSTGSESVPDATCLHTSRKRMPKFCSECGAKSSNASSKFCAECGTRYAANDAPSPGLVAETTAIMKEVPYEGEQGGSTQSYQNPFDASSVPMAKAVPPPPPVEKIPEAVSGDDAERLYAACINQIKRCNPGAVGEFKENCRAYGLSTMPVHTFYASLTQKLGPEVVNEMMPNLVQLMPLEEKRREIMLYHKGQSSMLSPTSSSSSATGRSMAMGAGKSNPMAKTTTIKRYADHPMCDICHLAFEVTRRRHQCRSCGLYICSKCSLKRLLIPPGSEIMAAKGYDPSVPQRVCDQCVPRLESVQTDLIAEFGKCNLENPHEAKGRLHVPYSSSLDKECRNAADIIGNFFRSAWGSQKDKHIPVSMLERAHGLAILTIIKAGFLITGKIGTGLVVAKLPDGSWSAPSAIGTAGMGGGLEIGGELVEVMIILGSAAAVKVFHRAQLNIGAGLDLAVGPYGRSADAAAAASKSGLNANYSYSQSKGLYAGISLQGAVISTRKDVNSKFYGQQVEAAQILAGNIQQPKAAQPLYDALNKAMQGVQEHRDTEANAIESMGGCKQCGCPRFAPHHTQIWNKNCKTCKHVH